MSASDLALVLATLLCAFGFAALIVVLLRVLRALAEIRSEVTSLRAETRPLLAELRQSVDIARDDLDRFDRVLGSAEAISSSVEGVSRVAKVALSAPFIKTVALASGTGRAAKQLMNGKANTREQPTQTRPTGRKDATRRRGRAR